MQELAPLPIAQFALAEFDPNSSFRPGDHLDPLLLQHRCFEIKTCQRTLFLYGLNSNDLNTNHDLKLLELKKAFTSFSRRHFEGVEAYEYLLRFACGLESEIKGETDVFGQVKTAYKALLEQSLELSQSMRTIFLKLFEDTKEIRAQHLQGIGGNTYGALARRLMNPTDQDRILVIGAGEISKSVAPYFADFSLKIWNRSEDRLQLLGVELAKKGHSPALFTCENELIAAIGDATLIVIATPFGSSIDACVSENRSDDSRVLHLGAQEHEVRTLPFPSLSLSDLFAIEQEQSQFRQKQVNQAIFACHERSLLRSLSQSIHVAHGWEDLAVFF